MKRKAFTLIELLVVIAILGLLAAILFPVFAHVRENGRRTVCLSNEHQLGLAIQMYAHDNDDTLPSGSHKGGTTTVSFPQDGPGGTGMGWAGEVYPYVKATAAFACPDDAPLSSYNTFYREEVDGIKVSPAGVPVSYGYNSLLATAPFFIGSARLGGIEGRMERLPRPADTVMLFEITGDKVDITRPDEGASQGVMLFSAAGDGRQMGAMVLRPSRDKLIHLLLIRSLFYATGRFVGDRDRPAGSSNDGAGDQFPDPAGRHGGGSNFLLADGHAKWVLPEKVCAMAGGTLGFPEANCAVHFHWGN